MKKNKKNNDKILDEIIASVDSSGYRSIKVSTLFRRFGYKKRGQSNISRINNFIKDAGLFCYPTIDIYVKWESTVKIYYFPVEKLGELFESEKDLEDFVDENNALKKLGIKNYQRQYSPKRTKDKLDFKGSNRRNDFAIELKHEEGGKSAVEQVLRYSGMLKQENPNRPIRNILITGVRGLSTAKAIHGMTIEQKENFEWYLYKYDFHNQTIDFERVTFTYLEEKLAIIHK